tara:strand:- start:12125 stop:13177 length:1053 start_codon:yes stop_codon:yes gene_type:complete
MKEFPKVTLGVINCNRLHYLKSCLESLIYCTEDYPNKEIFLVDNASIEEGTDEYLLEKEKQGIKVIRQKNRDPANEFAKAVNLITTESTGDFLCHLQGDMQFVIKGGWLEEYVSFYQKYLNHTGCICLDAQRTTRIKTQSRWSQKFHSDDYPFLYDSSRLAFCCSADVMYSRQSLEFMGLFSQDNEGHERGINSEDDMRNRLRSKIEKLDEFQAYHAMPLISPAVAIYTDARGTNARVRGNRRYGDYWEPKEDFRYYEITDYDEIISRFKDREFPVGIEELANPIGWEKPVNENGDWKKNPIRPDEASPSDYVDFGKEISLMSHSGVTTDENIVESNEPSYIQDWLDQGE